MTVEHVAIVGGTGDVGFGLAKRWAKAGFRITIGSRDPGRADSAAKRLLEQVPGAEASGLENAEAAASSSVVVVAVPFAGQAAIYKSIAESVQQDAVVVDCTVPLAAAVGGRTSRTLGVWEGSAAQQGAGLLPRGRASVCAAFHSLAASALDDLDSSIEGDVLVCGSRKEAKLLVKDLVGAIPNLRYVDAGPLENARLVEPLTSLLIGINRRYRTTAGIRITNLPE